MQVEFVERAAVLLGGGEFGECTDSVDGQAQSHIRRTGFADNVDEYLLPPVHTFPVVGVAVAFAENRADMA